MLSSGHSVGMDLVSITLKDQEDLRDSLNGPVNVNVVAVRIHRDAKKDALSISKDFSSLFQSSKRRQGTPTADYAERSWTMRHSELGI